MSELTLLVVDFELQLCGFSSRSDNVSFVLVSVGLRLVFSEYVSFPYQFSFKQLLRIR